MNVWLIHWRSHLYWPDEVEERSIARGEASLRDVSSWPVYRSRGQIAAGDLVLIWRTSGGARGDSEGIVGVGVVTRRAAPGTPGPADSGVPPWTIGVELLADLSISPVSGEQLGRTGVQLLAKPTASTGPWPVSNEDWEAVADFLSVALLDELQQVSEFWAGRDTHAVGSSIDARWNVEASIRRKVARDIDRQSRNARRFRHLRIGGWRQFGDVSISFDDRCTVITGANGTGKSSLLALLAMHFDWPANFVSRASYVNGVLTYSADAAYETFESTLAYSDGTSATMPVPGSDGPIHSLQWRSPESVNGLYIPSHRPAPAYQVAGGLSPSFSAAEVLLEQYVAEARARANGGTTGKASSTYMKEALLASAMHGLHSADENIDWEGNVDARSVWVGFQSVLRRLLPAQLGFLRLSARPPELVLVCDSGEFGLDAVSGGISALIDLGWQIFLRSRLASAFTVVFDEPENHLHPEMQRHLLPNLLVAFPEVTFIVATHSPFVVTSVAEANVVALDYNDRGLVISSTLDMRAEPKSAEEVLARVLGVESTLPQWADDSINRLLVRYQEGRQTPKALRDLLRGLESEGLLRDFPATSAIIARQLESDA